MSEDSVDRKDNGEIAKYLAKHSDRNEWGTPTMAKDFDVLSPEGGSGQPLKQSFNGVKLGEQEFQKGNYDKAAEHFLVAIEEDKNNEKAKLNLGIMYSRGFIERGINPGNKTYLGEAKRLLIDLATAGNPSAQTSIGMLFGHEGNYKESNKWLMRASAQGHRNAQYLLGVKYAQGIGIEKNYSKAIKSFKKVLNVEDKREERLFMEEDEKELIKFTKEQLVLIDKEQKLDSKSMSKDKKVQQDGGIKM